ncbi:MAG: Zn-dependent exopeptidase M28 [bacterium]|nr:Zn-dependent exopeptidase M28 [bacterium]
MLRHPSIANAGRRVLRAALLLLVALLATAARGDGFEPAETRVCGTFAIRDLGFERLSALERTPDLETWAELDDLLFACGTEEAFDRLSAAGHAATRRWAEVPRGSLFVVRGAHPGSGRETGGLEILARGGPYSLVWPGTGAARRALAAGRLPGETSGDHAGCGHSHVQPLAGQMVLARQSSNRAPRGATVFGPEAEQAADAVDGDRWLADVATLAGWNRYTHGPQIDLARDWLVARWSAMPGLAVSTQSFQVGGTTADNVIAVLPGSTRPDDWVLVGGHYDATSEAPFTAAPGAEDNASGCAGVLEMARVLTAMPPEATVVFICYSGEEQGLYGSVDHASRLVDQGDDSKVDLMLNMDMIGYTGDADLDCLLETDPPFASILEPFEDAADAYTMLRIVTSLFAFGSDHVPYLDRDMPALLTIENDWDNYPSYHSTTDLPDNLTLEMGTQTLRMNAAVLAHVAGAAVMEVPIFADGFESGDTGAW